MYLSQCFMASHCQLLDHMQDYTYFKHMQHAFNAPHSSASIQCSYSKLCLVQHGRAAACTLSNIQIRLKAMTLLLSPIMLVGSRVGRRTYCQANLSHPGLSPTCNSNPDDAASSARHCQSIHREPMNIGIITTQGTAQEAQPVQTQPCKMHMQRPLVKL